MSVVSQFINPLSPNGDKHLISPYSIKHTGHKNQEIDHLRQDDLMCKEILPTSSIRNKGLRLDLKLLVRVLGISISGVSQFVN